MSHYVYWSGVALVILASAIGVNEVKQHRWRPRPVAIALVVGLIVVFVPPLQLLNRAQWRVQFGTFSATASPPRVQLCGRWFYPDSQTVTLAQARLQEGRPLEMVAQTPAGTPILANAAHAHTGDCIITLYVETVTHRYAVYSLSGGP